MNLKYIVNNLDVKNVLANYIMIDMSTDDKLSSYGEDIVKVNDKYLIHNKKRRKDNDENE